MTYLTNLKECSICKFFLDEPTRFSKNGLFAVTASLLICSQFALSAPSPYKGEASKQNQETIKKIISNIEKDLRQHREVDFKDLISNWNRRYGDSALDPLMMLVNRPGTSDRDLYISMMAIGRIGRTKATPLLLSKLEHPSWMVRSASLKSIAQYSRNGPVDVYPIAERLFDKALVVRMDAVKALEALRNPVAIPSLLKALHDPSNYHKGKSLWVPLQIVESLRAYPLKKHQLKELRPVFKSHKKDPKLAQSLVRTLERLTHNPTPADLPRMSQKIRYWDQYLKRL